MEINVSETKFNSFRMVPVTRFMSEGHYLIIVINFPKIPIDQPLENTWYHALTLKDLLTWDIFIPIFIGIVVLNVITTITVLLVIWRLYKKMQTDNSTINKSLLNEGAEMTEKKVEK